MFWNVIGSKTYLKVPTNLILCITEDFQKNSKFANRPFADNPNSYKVSLLDAINMLINRLKLNNKVANCLDIIWRLITRLESDIKVIKSLL